MLPQGVKSNSAILLIAIGIVAYIWPSSNITSSEPTGAWVCETPSYSIRMISYEPFIMHIENFLTQWEAAYLLELGQSIYKPSKVNTENGISPGRTSSTATLPLEDVVATCIRARAAEIQGFMPIEHVERLQLTRYLEGQQYRAHFDWSRTGSRENERLSTFFAILEANCTHCGTQFPEVIDNWQAKDSRWCGYLECEDSGEHALTTKPKVGSAVYWRNLNEAGVGDERTLHAGLPVTNGSKVGLNIWTRIGPIQR